MAEPIGWQFWLTLSAEAGTAIGTIAAVVVALFGERLHGRFGAPKLEISLVDPNGLCTPTIIDPDGKATDTLSRWYHLRVENKRRWSPAKDVHFVLLKFEQRDGELAPYRPKWVGEVPLLWSFQQTPRTIGPARNCDLCSVLKGRAGQKHTLSLHPQIQPYNLTISWQEEVRFRLTLQAHGRESDSDLFHVEILWNGQWDDDTIKMAKHLQVKPATLTE